jgi:hypothetical protein
MAPKRNNKVIVHEIFFIYLSFLPIRFIGQRRSFIFIWHTVDPVQVLFSAASADIQDEGYPKNHAGNTAQDYECAPDGSAGVRREGCVGNDQTKTAYQEGHVHYLFEALLSHRLDIVTL